MNEYSRRKKRGATMAEKKSERGREREKPLSNTLWVIYQTVSHTCGPQSSAKTPTHNYHTSNMSPFDPFKNFFGTKTLFC